MARANHEGRALGFLSSYCSELAVMDPAVSVTSEGICVLSGWAPTAHKLLSPSFSHWREKPACGASVGG